MSNSKNVDQDILQSRIFVVDDEPFVTESIKDILSSEGYGNVITMNTSTSVLEHISQFGNPDLVLMDVHLGIGDSGVEIVKQFPKGNNIGVLYLTGYTDQKNLNNVLTTKPDAFLTKPFTESSLLANVNIILQKKKEHVEIRQILDTVLYKEAAETEDILKNFGLWLKSARKNRKITQVQISEDLSINYRHYQSIEAGKINLRLDTFMKLIQYFKNK